MAISALMAAVSTGVTALAGGAYLSIAAIGLTGAFGHFLITTAMGAALNALAPRPNLASTRGFSINGESGAALDHQIIYGRARVGGARVYDSSTGETNEYLHRILAFAGHEIDSYDEIYLNDEVVTIDPSTGNVTSPARYDGFVRIKKYLGTISQTADADLIADTASLTDGKWTSDHRLQNIAYLYVRFKYSADVFPNGVPVVSATIRGKKVYDPRTMNTGWSENPALCIRDYLLSDYGLNQTTSKIDETSFITAANICDELVADGKRYTCNGNFVTALQPSQILSDMLSSMGGLFWYSQGKWRVKAAKFVTPVLSFDENDLRSGISLATRHSRRSNFNTIKGKFRGPESDWQESDYPPVTSATFISEDDGLVNTLDYSLPFVSTSAAAQRIANIALRRNRKQLSFTASFGLKALQVEVGDFININNARFGWVNKTFEVVNWSFGLTEGLDIQVQMTLREITADVFEAVAANAYDSGVSTLPNPFADLSITGLVATGGGRLQTDGTFINSAILTWNAPSNQFVDYYDVEWKAVVDSSYSATTTTNASAEISPLIDDIQYEIRVRAVTVNGIRGPWTSIFFTGGGDVTAPSLPTNVVAVGDFKYVSINWTNPADSDLNYIEIWENTTNTTSGATRVGISSGDSFQRTNLPIDTTRWYFLRAVDYSGNVSGYTTGVSATTTGLEDEDFANGIYSLFTDQGLYAIKDVTSLPPSGTFVGEKVFNRTDGKLYQWTGSVWDLVIAEPDTFIASDKIIANTITGGLLATSGIITNSAQIGDAVITNAKIANLAVDTLKIAGNAVTIFRGATGTGSSTNSTWVTVASITFTPSATDVSLMALAGGEATAQGTSDNIGTANVRMVWRGSVVRSFTNVALASGNNPVTGPVAFTEIISAGSGSGTLEIQVSRGGDAGTASLSASLVCGEFKK